LFGDAVRRRRALRDRLVRESSCLDDALRVASGVADALAYAHRLGIVHRDIKPENILLQAGHPVVSDFGIASAVQAATKVKDKLTDPGFAVGTPAYMSPEQSVGTWWMPGDVYSLAACCTDAGGRPPFTGATAQAIQARRSWARCRGSGRCGRASRRGWSRPSGRHWPGCPPTATPRLPSSPPR
jgi:serine/threonine-protein kinase